MTAITFDTHQAQIATKSDLRELEYRLTLRMGAMIATAIVIITALDKLL